MADTLLIVALPTFRSLWLFPVSVLSFSPIWWSCSWASQNLVQPFTPRLLMNAPKASCVTCTMHSMWFLNAGHSILEASRGISGIIFCSGGLAPWEWTRSIRAVGGTPASIRHVALYIALQSLFYHFFAFSRSPILNDYACVVANCDHTSEWVHWVCACIWIAMWCVKLRQLLLAFLLPARKMQFSLY